MKPLFTILFSLLLVILPAKGSFAPTQTETACGKCSRCCCCVQPNSSRPTSQAQPVSAPSRTISLERFAEQIEPATNSPILTELAIAPLTRGDSLNFLRPIPFFERYCSLLI